MRVGVSVAQSGPLSMMGSQALKGIRLWISRFEPAGTVSLIARDDCGRLSLARDNTRALINEDKVDVLFGPYSSHLTKAACEISEAHQMLLWNHGGASDELFRAKPAWIASTLSPASRYFQKLPGWITANDSGINRYLLLATSKGTFAAEVAAGFREAILLLTRPVRLICAELPEAPEDLVSLLNVISPQVLLLAGPFEQETALLQTRPQWPNSIRYICCVAAGVRGFYDDLGHLSQDVIGPSQWEPVAAGAPATGPTSDEFVQQFKESFGEMPDYVAAGAFAAGLVAELCIRRAGSLQAAGVREVASDLATETFYGRFRIDSVGRQIGHEMRLVRWDGDRKVVIA
jgi:branched-chain amino acid transport system substrate-binding protein